ncbi:MAG: hypothetical protein ACJAVK_000728 [Akkermansiaceae bacterium]|jgi:hypothetical protein
MHPELLPTSDVNWDLKDGHLVGTSPKAASQSQRWIGGFNPFATYDLAVHKTKGSGSTGITFLDSTNGDTLATNLHFEEGKPMSISWAVTLAGKQGAPLLDEGRLWFTITVRGRALPLPLQGVFSLNPSVFDIRFEGIIVFDMDDGLLRNELASHLFRDSKSGEWRGWTTGFSALGGTGRGDSKTILAVSSVRDPPKGFSIMKAKPIGIIGAHQDRHGVYDTASGK